MQLTATALILLLCGALLFLGSAYWPWAEGAAVAWMSGVFALAVIDALLTRRAAAFTVEREVEEKLSLGVPNPVRLRVRNRTDRRLRLWIKDNPPVDFRTPDRLRMVDLGSFGEAAVTYETTPTGRGDFGFHSIHVRGLGRLRLCSWQKALPAEQHVRVYPDLIGVERYEALARLHRLQEAGFRAVHIRGRGTQFESLREYMPDDEYRSIDWKATARRDRPIVRVHEVERSQTVMLMLDAGRMMTAQIGDMSKLDYAVNSALMLAHVVAATDDAVGMMAFGRAIHSFVPPRKGPAQVGRILEQLYRVQPALEEPNYAQAFATLAQRSRKRALVVIFSDLVDMDASRRIIAHLEALGRRHLPMLVTIEDTDLVRASLATPGDVSEAYQRAVAGNVLAERETALGWLRARGTLVVNAPAGELTVAAVNQYLALKSAGRL